MKRLWLWLEPPKIDNNTPIRRAIMVFARCDCHLGGALRWLDRMERGGYAKQQRDQKIDRKVGDWDGMAEALGMDSDQRPAWMDGTAVRYALPHNGFGGRKRSGEKFYHSGRCRHLQNSRQKRQVRFRFFPRYCVGNNPRCIDQIFHLGGDQAYS